MASSFKVVLHSIKCDKTSESESDELYFHVAIYDADGNKTFDKRLPEDQIWEVRAGNQLVVGAEVASLNSSVPETLRIIVHEEDVPDFSRKLFSKLSKLIPKQAPDLIDDCLGEFYIIRDKEDDFSIKEGLYAAFIETEDDYYHFKIKQMDSYDYTILLDIQELSK